MHYGSLSDLFRLREATNNREGVVAYVLSCSDREKHSTIAEDTVVVLVLQMPIWLPTPRHGPSVAVWGQLRPADHTTTQTASLQFLPTGASVLQQLGDTQTSSPEGFLFTHVSIPSAGAVRLAWSAPDGSTLYSRAAPVS